MKIIIENNLDRAEIRMKQFKLGLEIMELLKLYGLDIKDLNTYNYSQFFYDLGTICGQYKNYQDALEKYKVDKNY